VHRRRRPRLPGGDYPRLPASARSIVDFDVVDFNNLQRQIIPARRRRPVEAGIGPTRAINPHVHLETFETAVVENALELFAGTT
jgi:molybdopterin/thiamine biosynthesis adenylyltransferase